MLTGELPFQAPSVPALLMKQITEEPTPIDVKRPEVPRELALIVMRCLEKDPEDRWPTADALRRALETGTYVAPPPRASRRRSSGTGAPRTSSEASRRGSSQTDRQKAMDWLAERRGERPSAAGPRPPRPPYEERRLARQSQRYDAADRRRDKKAEEEAELEALAKERGEPLIVTKFRHSLARYAAFNGVLLTVAILADFNGPWMLVPAFWGVSVARQYARLWTAGYSWRDVIHRAPAPDSIDAQNSPRSLLAPVSPRELGKYAGQIEQARADRAAVLAMLERLSKSERAMLPSDLVPTVDHLLERATELARTLALVDRDINDESVDNADARIRALESEPPSSDKERRLALLRQQRDKVAALADRRGALNAQFDSCILAMQNVRFDLLRLRSAGMDEALGDLTQATQQARALSRDVDAAISAVSEVRRLTRT
jgi:hypothetical protein